MQGTMMLEHSLFEHDSSISVLAMHALIFDKKKLDLDQFINL